MDQFEIDIEADRRIKAIKEERYLGPINVDRPLCAACGTDFIVHRRGDDDWTPLCTSCLLRRFNGRPHKQVVATPEHRRRSCNRCWEERPLVGAWCVPCRDKFQWAYIVELIQTERKTEEQSVFLTNVAPHWPVWSQHESDLRAWGVWVTPPVVQQALDDVNDNPSAA